MARRMKHKGKPNPYVPLYVDLRDRRALVVGGGETAARKASDLARHGCVPKVVAPRTCGQIDELERDGKIRLFRREFKDLDLRGCFIVFAATDSVSVDQAVLKAAQACGVLASLASGLGGDVIAPSELSHGRFQMSVSTSGSSTALDEHVRSILEGDFDESWGALAELVFGTRKLVSECIEDPERRAEVLQGLDFDSILTRIQFGEQISPEKLYCELVDPESMQLELGMEPGREIELDLMAEVGQGGFVVHGHGEGLR